MRLELATTDVIIPGAINYATEMSKIILNLRCEMIRAGVYCKALRYEMIRAGVYCKALRYEKIRAGVYCKVLRYESNILKQQLYVALQLPWSKPLVFLIWPLRHCSHINISTKVPLIHCGYIVKCNRVPLRHCSHMDISN